MFLLLVGLGDDGQLAAADRIDADVAPCDLLFVVLLGQDGADQARDRGPVGEDAYNVGAAAQFAVEPLLWVVAPDLAPHVLGERGVGEHVGCGVGQ